MAFRLLKFQSGIRSTVPHAGKVLWSLRQASSSRQWEEQITVTDDGSTIVCWHPEPCFPYECSRPLPPVHEETHSILKVQSLDEVHSVFVEKKEEFIRQELMNLTYTTKHRWFPRTRENYVKKTKPDREYL